MHCTTAALFSILATLGTAALAPAPAPNPAQGLSPRGQQPLLTSQLIRLVARSFVANNPVEQFYVSSVHDGAGSNALVLNETAALATGFYFNATAEEYGAGQARLLSPLEPSTYVNSVVMSGEGGSGDTPAAAGTRFAGAEYAVGTAGFNVTTTSETTSTATTTLSSSTTSSTTTPFAYPYLSYTPDAQDGTWYTCYRRLTYGPDWTVEWHAQDGVTPEGCWDVVLVPECGGDLSDVPDAERAFVRESECWRDARGVGFPVRG